MKKIWIVGSLGHMGQALIRLLDMMEYELYETIVHQTFPACTALKSLRTGAFAKSSEIE